MTKHEWELRAKERRIENKALKKRIKELTISRDSWKAKHKSVKMQLNGVQKQIETVKKNLQIIYAQCRTNEVHVVLQ